MHLFKYRLINETVKLNGALLVLKRFKTKKGSKSRESGCCDRALQHFDSFYNSVFAEKWPSVRLGLLSKQRYFALINNFADVEETEKFLQKQGAVDLRTFLEAQKQYVLQSEESSKPKTSASDIDKVVLGQLKVEEEKESQIHPEGLEFSTRADPFNEDNEFEKKEELLYDPEDPQTSLAHDLSHKSQIDMGRMILPGSSGDAKLEEFMPATELRGDNFYVAEADYYKFWKVKKDASFTIEEERDLDFPENLKVYTFDRGDVSEFPDSTRCVGGIYNFLKVDGADLLAALVLGVEKNDRVLDLCSTSEDIAYCVFQTLRPKHLLCTQAKQKTEDLFREHLVDFSPSWNDILCISSGNIDEVDNESLFDKVLVDVPCTNDRMSLFEEENNPFHILKVKTRLRLPEFQTEYLKKGLRLVRPGGTVVYTTSTLSPVQNDAVVLQALTNLWLESKLQFTVKDLTPALRHTTLFFNYGNYLNMKFGTLVVPFTPVNFGPRYICKIIRKEQEEEKTVEETSKISTETLNC